MLDHSCHATVIPSAHKLTAEVECKLLIELVTGSSNE